MNVLSRTRAADGSEVLVLRVRKRRRPPQSSDPLCACHRQQPTNNRQPRTANNRQPRKNVQQQQTNRRQQQNRTIHGGGLRVECTTQQLSARAKRFAAEAQTPPPPIPKRRMAWHGGKISSNKEEALQKFLARSATASDSDSEKTLSPQKRQQVLRHLAQRQKAG